MMANIHFANEGVDAPTTEEVLQHSRHYETIFHLLEGVAMDSVPATTPRTTCSSSVVYIPA